MTEDTESGTLTWRIYKSRAELWGIQTEGHDNVELVIPSAFRGLPVAAIRAGAIASTNRKGAS